MSVSKTDMASGSRPLGSDLAKVDAYENTASDYEESPEVTTEEFARARLNRNGIPVRHGRLKILVSIELDEDILASFKELGGDWQAAINGDLRHCMITRREGRRLPHRGDRRKR